MARIPKVVPTASIRDDRPESAWEEGEEVTIKTYLGSYDRKRIASLSTRISAGDAGLSRNQVVEARLHEVSLAYLESCVVSWTITYEDGTALPCTPEGMRQLPEPYVDFVVNEIIRHNRAWEVPEDAQKTFRPALAPGHGRTKRGA